MRAPSVVLLLTLLAAPIAVDGQPAAKIPRLGVLEPFTAPGGGCLTGFRQGLRELGHVEGQTIAVDYRFANGDPARLAALAADLAQQSPDAPSLLLRADHIIE